MQDIITAISLIMVLGVASQWVAWRLKIPAIVLMFFVGLFIGPISGFFEPTVVFDEFFKPFRQLPVNILIFRSTFLGY